MSSLAKLPIRSVAAVRHAEREDLGPGFCYSITLGAFDPPAGMSYRLERYLCACGVLIRSGEFGFRGYRLPNWCAVDFVRRVTRGPTSEQTLRRMVKEAAAGGWIVLSYYGGGAARECLNRRTGEAYTIRDQVPVVTFTPKLFALFGRRCPTLDHGYQSGSVSFAPSGRSGGFSLEKTPAGARDRSRSSVEPFEAAKEVPSAFAPGALNCEGSAAPSDRASDSAAASAGKPGEKGSKTRAKSQGKRGGRVPSELHGARPFVRSQVARDLLAVLAAVAEKHGRAGRAAVARAALELADPAAARGSVVCWDYWLSRWGDLTRSERRRALRSEVLPGLLALGGAVIVGLPTRAAPPSPPRAPASPAASPAARPPEQRSGEAAIPEPGREDPAASAAALEKSMREAAAAGNKFAADYCRSRGWLS